MDHPSLTDADIERLSTQIDQELMALAQTEDPMAFRSLAAGKARLAAPKKQLEAIERATGEPAENFWARFKQAAWKDLCHEDGLLYQQWHKWKDLSNKDLVKFSYGILVGLGITGATLYVVIVAVAVIILHLGVKTICEEGG